MILQKWVQNLKINALHSEYKLRILVKIWSPRSKRYYFFSFFCKRSLKLLSLFKKNTQIKKEKSSINIEEHQRNFKILRSGRNDH